jgi:hypothetical protein
MIRTAAVAALVAGVAAFPRPLRADDPVAVSAVASKDYGQRKFGSGSPKRETYLFFQGKFFGGSERDPDLERAQFIDIAKILAVNLVRQNYVPTKDQQNADLLIVVHWGTTTVYQDPNAVDNTTRKNVAMARYNSAVAAAQAATGGNPGPTAPDTGQSGYLGLDQGEVNSELALADAENATSAMSVASNSALLGFGRDLAKAEDWDTASSSGMSTEEVSLRLLLSEERYFVILMAYDYHTMKKGSRPKLLWTTRFSVRAPGNSFTGVLPAMSRAAADYFGQNLDRLKFQKPGDLREGKVQVGEPKVVGSGK